MPNIMGKSLEVDKSDEHIIRRLGKAVVWQWDELSPEVQNRIREQAVFMADTYQTVQLNEQIGKFIRDNKGPKE